jgi:hypothetical protein
LKEVSDGLTLVLKEQRLIVVLATLTAAGTADTTHGEDKHSRSTLKSVTRGGVVLCRRGARRFGSDGCRGGRDERVLIVVADEAVDGVGRGRLER